MTQETKSAIQSYAREKYRSVLENILEDADESISQKSIENAIGRIRKKMGIVNPKGKRNSPVRGISKEEPGHNNNDMTEESIEKQLKEIFARLQQERPEEWEEIIHKCLYFVKNC